MGKGDQCVYTSMLMSATPDSVLCLPAAPPLIHGKKQVQTTILTYGPRSSTNSQFCFDNDFISLLLFICIIFCSIYSRTLSFCSFSFFWDIFFFCATSSSGLGTICSFSSHLNVAGRAHVGVDPTVSSVSPAPHRGGFVH